MHSRFTKNITPFVEAELQAADRASQAGDAAGAFQHLENAHVIGQESTYWHVKVHLHMLRWAIRNRKLREFFGQTFRVAGAATKTAAGLVPKGNTGGANVSPFKQMPIKPEHMALIKQAREQ